MSIELVMPSNHLILCHPLLLLLSVFPSIRSFLRSLCIRWPKYWSFSFSISPSKDYAGLISFRIDWFDLLASPRNSPDLQFLLEGTQWPYMEKAMAPTPVLSPGKSHGRRSLVAAVHGVAKSWIWLSNFTFTFHLRALKKEVATHSSVLAWRIPGTGEPGGLPSMGSHRVGHDWSSLAAVATAVVIQCCLLLKLNLHQSPDFEDLFYFFGFYLLYEKVVVLLWH